MVNRNRKQRVIFLDRDGVINKFPGRTKYVASWREFKFLPGSLAALRKLTQAGFLIFVISNQAGVRKKIYTKATLKAITDRMLKRIESKGGEIKKVLYCTHSSADNCSCRKPKTALINKALSFLDFKIDRRHSYLIGDDTARDIPLGKRARLKTILVLSGRDRLSQRASWLKEPDYIFKNLLKAVDFVIKKAD